MIDIFILELGILASLSFGFGFCVVGLYFVWKERKW